MGHFWTNSNSRKLKTQAKNIKKQAKKQKTFINSSHKTKLWEISLKLFNFIGKKHKFANQNHTLCQDFQDFWLKVWYLTWKLNLKAKFPANSFGLYLPKPGPISKLDLWFINFEAVSILYSGPSGVDLLLLISAFLLNFHCLDCSQTLHLNLLSGLHTVVAQWIFMKVSSFLFNLYWCVCVCTELGSCHHQLFTIAFQIITDNAPSSLLALLDILTQMWKISNDPINHCQGQAIGIWMYLSK